MRRYSAFHSAPAPPPASDRHITLDVVVDDKSGKPVTGLGQQDFTLLDNKQPQKILSFEVLQAGPATVDPPVDVVLLVVRTGSNRKMSKAGRRQTPAPGIAGCSLRFGIGDE